MRTGVGQWAQLMYDVVVEITTPTSYYFKMWISLEFRQKTSHISIQIRTGVEPSAVNV